MLFTSVSFSCPCVLIKNGRSGVWTSVVAVDGGVVDEDGNGGVCVDVVDVEVGVGMGRGGEGGMGWAL